MEIIDKIKNAKKKTPVKIYLKEMCHALKEYTYPATIFGEWSEIEPILVENRIEDYIVENDRRNAALNLLNTLNLNARIEPGAIIREGAQIEENAIIMMGAVLNIGCIIGKRTMIDMGAIIGARVEIAEDCHVGANAVLAGTIEPPSLKPVIIDKNVLIGANAVILEGIHIYESAVIGAGAVVCEDVPAFCVVAGVPAKIIKTKDEQTAKKTKIVDELRQI